MSGWITLDIYQRLHECLENNIDVVLLTVTDVKHKNSKVNNQELNGFKLLYTADEHLFSKPNSPQSLQKVLLETAKQALSQKISKIYTQTISLKPAQTTEVEIYAEVYPSPPHLIVAGAGHVAKPVVQLGKMIGMYVTVICDRPQYANREQFPWADEVVCKQYVDYFRNLQVDDNTFILLLTRGHQYDVMILREMLGRQMRYLGMIGSKRRISGVFSQLATEFTEENFQNIFAPIGLYLGAQNPEEIAASKKAEILTVKNGRSGDSLRDRVRYFIRRKE